MESAQPRALSLQGKPPPSPSPGRPSEVPAAWSPRFLLRGQQRSVSGTHASQLAPGELKEREGGSPNQTGAPNKTQVEESARPRRPRALQASRPRPRPRPRRDAHGPARDARAATVPAPGRRPGGRAPAALARRRGRVPVCRRRGAPRSPWGRGTG